MLIYAGILTEQVATCLKPWISACLVKFVLTRFQDGPDRCRFLPLEWVSGLGTVPVMIQIRLSARGRVLRLCGMLIAVSQLVTAGLVWGDDRTARREIFVASNGWHSAIFVARAAIPSGAISVAPDFPKAVYLGFGWGDADYFPKRDPGILTLLSAAFQPTPSVLHVTGLSSHPRAAFPKDEVIGVTLSADGFRDLLGFLNAAFSRDGAGRVTAIAPGLHAFSKFYRAKGDFHLFNNCNSWTARGIAAAGLPIEADGIIRADGLMSAVREIAK